MTELLNGPQPLNVRLGSESWPGGHVRVWRILLQKSAVTDDAARAFHLRRRGLVPDPGALYATLTLRNAQSLSGWRPSDKRREAP
jgi:hypothetical protein